MNRQTCKDKLSTKNKSEYDISYNLSYIYS